MAGRNIAVLGAGSWGTALAIQAARAGQDVCLWGLETGQIEQMQQERCNRFYLPDIAFPASLRLSSDLDASVQPADTLLIAVPSHAFRSFLQSAKSRIHPGQHIVWATKGLEDGSAKLMHQILAEELPQSTQTAVISGPTFAREVAQNLPTAITAAARTTELAWQTASFLHFGNFRVYTSDDIPGVELGGSLKNVLAIAAGIADGLGFGANTRAALITRGLAEIMRLGDTMGAQRETFMGLAGLGDLVLTCTDNQSRNRRMGLKLASGLSVDAARKEIGQAVEGINTAREAYTLGRKHQVELPIIEQTYRVLFENLAPKNAVHALLARGHKAE
ncbi:MAG: glycerol-3-phosphate dehydrogenase [Pseudomonadota bacterium]|nr:glycerol-3-phosphate dehydrogenase [Pseudomonadota bacterium]